LSENNEVPGLEAIRMFQDLWETCDIVSFIVDAKEEYLFLHDPQYGWDDITNGAISYVLRELGGRFYIDDVDTLEDFLEVINYYKSYTDALLADEEMSKTVDCTLFVIKSYELYRKLNAKPILGEPVNQFLAPRASEELDRYRDRILRMDKSLSAITEPFESIPTDKMESDDTTAAENSEYIFIREDDFWDITFEKEKLKPIKQQGGLVYIQYLLRNRGKIVDALDLNLLNNPAPPTKLLNEPYDSGLEYEDVIPDAFVSANDVDNVENIADPEILEDIAENLKDLREEIDEAEKNNDTRRVDKLSKDIQELEIHLRRLKEFRGRSPKFTGDSDRARSAVSRAINRAYRSLEPHSPKLVAHLKKNIEKGSKIIYSPEHEIDWAT
jgi:hypothetical protein